MSSQDGLLSGIRVLDFCRFVAGPFCGALLADHGAEVIRIDRVGGSEDRFILPMAQTGVGPVFMQCNRGKRSLTLNATSPEGREIVRKLIGTADVVVANLPGATLKSMGLDYATISAINPRIILATTNAFGHTGPDSEKVGFDGIAQCLSGAAYLTGEPGAPRRAAAPYVDYGTAISAALGVVLALMARERTGRGQEVTGSLMATALTMGNSFAIEQAMNRTNRVPQANLGYTSAPADVYECSDGQWMVLQMLGDSQWRKFCEVIGAQDWLQDPRFRDDESRGRNGALVSERTRAWCAQRTRAEAIALFEKARLPAGPVYTPQQMLDDPHVRASGMLREVSFPGAPMPAPICETPIRLSETPGRIRGRAPLAGEHTLEVLAGIGYSAQDVERLRAAGVV